RPCLAAGAARRAREGAVRGEPDDREPGHHRRSAPGAHAVGLRARRTSVPPLRHDHPGARATRAGTGHLLVPVLPASGFGPTPSALLAPEPPDTLSRVP